MTRLAYVGVGLAMLWLQVSLAPYLAIGGIKPNFLLLSVLVLQVRWLDPWAFLFAAVAGLAVDTFSHGMLGAYAASYVATAVLGRRLALMIYENSRPFTVLLVAGLTVLEGLIALAVLNLLDEQVPWFTWLFTRVLPQAAYHALLCPFALWGVERLERLLKVVPPRS
ncbi:MAG: rod shape-determining protein MreD [Candidatus Lambdaproteobacteria bacterium]|nr:rod shape-determining protein MreD [Candidatus Lambdaproteobacteria bacterium]